MKVLLWINANLVALIACQSYRSKVNVDVYFEALCPDSHNFIISQLYPNWEDIKDYVHIRFIPFGKSTSLDNGTKFACQHGSIECKGNRIMSCALSRMPEQDLQVQYLRCFMDVFKYAPIDDHQNGQKCFKLLGLNYEEIMTNCYQTREGTNLQLQAEADTKPVNPRFVPTIIYDGVFDQDLQDKSVKSFRETVCKLIETRTQGRCSYRTLIAF